MASKNPNDNEEQTTENTFNVPNPYARDYLDTVQGRILNDSTTEKRECELRLFVEHLHEHDTSVLEAEKSDVKEFLRVQSDKDNRRETIRNKLSGIRELYKHIRTECDDAEPALKPHALDDMDQLVKKFTTPPAMNREGLDEDEFDKLVEAAACYRDQLMILVAYETAARNTELRNIRIEDIDLKKSKIKFPSTKGNKSTTKPITEKLALELEQWIEVDREAWPTAERSPYLFPADSGEKIETNEGFNKIIKEAAERADIQQIKDTSKLTDRQIETMNSGTEQRKWSKVTAHVLRHTHVKHFIGELDDNVIQDHLDHESFATTEKYYIPEEDYDDEIRDAVSGSWNLG